MIFGNRLRVAKLTPLEWLTTSRNCARSRSARLAATITSAVAARLIALRKLFSSFATWPEPDAPMCEMRALNVSMTGVARASASREPPAMIVSVPCLGRRRAARDAGVDERDARSASAAQILTRRGRRRRAQIDDDLARAGVLEQPSLAQHDRLDGRAVGQREEHDLCRRRELRDRGIAGRRPRLPPARHRGRSPAPAGRRRGSAARSGRPCCRGRSSRSSCQEHPSSAFPPLIRCGPPRRRPCGRRAGSARRRPGRGPGRRPRPLARSP